MFVKSASLDEYLALVAAALALIIVLVACFMSIQLYRLRKPERRHPEGCPGLVK